MFEIDPIRQSRIDAKIAEIKRDFAQGLGDYMRQLNRKRLRRRGTITADALVDRNSLRWTLAWKEQHKVSYQLSVVVGVEDDGQTARVSRVWVHRKASTPLDYDGHTPTTRMRLTGLSLDEIKEAIDAEMGLSH
jgi:hypothetical protein